MAWLLEDSEFIWWEVTILFCTPSTNTSSIWSNVSIGFSLNPEKEGRERERERGRKFEIRQENFEFFLFVGRTFDIETDVSINVLANVQWFDGCGEKILNILVVDFNETRFHLVSACEVHARNKNEKRKARIRLKMEIILPDVLVSLLCSSDLLKQVIRKLRHHTLKIKRKEEKKTIKMIPRASKKPKSKAKKFSSLSPAASSFASACHQSPAKKISFIALPFPISISFFLIFIFSLVCYDLLSDLRDLRVFSKFRVLSQSKHVKWAWGMEQEEKIFKLNLNGEK